MTFYKWIYYAIGKDWIKSSKIFDKIHKIYSLTDKGIMSLEGERIKRAALRDELEYDDIKEESLRRIGY